MNLIEALNTDKPIKNLLQIAEQNFLSGKQKEEILSDFDMFCDSLENESKIDIVLEAMDVIDGWCTPDKDIIINQSKTPTCYDDHPLFLAPIENLFLQLKQYYKEHESLDNLIYSQPDLIPQFFLLHKNTSHFQNIYPYDIY